MGRHYANKLIGAAEVVANVGDNCHQLPSKEAHCRELSKLEPAQQAEAWAEAPESGTVDDYRSEHSQTFAIVEPQQVHGAF